LIVLCLLWRSPSAAAALVCCICCYCLMLLLACLLAWSICTWLLPHAPCLLHLYFLFLHLAAVQCCNSSSSRVWGRQNNVKPNVQQEEEEATTNVNRERLNPSYLLSMVTGLDLQ
jgi:cytochrome bd-type quinol oxidase subunit 1